MSNYLTYLIWMMLFVIVIEMVFPDSPYRKYLKLVVGCILIYTMIRPVLDIVHVDSDTYNNYVDYYQTVLEEVVNGTNKYNEQLSDQQQSLEQIYQTSMKTYLESQLDVTVQSLNIKFKEGNIQDIYLTIGGQADAIQIGEIRIADKSNTVNGDEEKLKNKIKSLLNDFYNVQVDNIYITIQKN